MAARYVAAFRIPPLPSPLVTVFEVAGVDPLEGRGCYTADLARALKRIGFDPGKVWYRADLDDLPELLERQFAAMHADFVRGVPSIVCMRTGRGRDATEHLRLVLGYDAEKDEIIYHEPAERDGAYRRMARKQLYELWPLTYPERRPMVIRLRLAAGRLAKPAAREGFTAADYAQHLRVLKTKLPKEGFTVVMQPPFVVIGDEPPATVKARAERTVKWAVTRLKRAYFAKDPDHIIEIWLFRDKRSYMTHAKEIFGDEPDTPFGYASTRHRALIMNIATGGGTLVHEIVHPFVDANFPACPAWFNEGLGSLYEQSSSRDGEIVGLTNWRLAGLQKAIRAKRVPSFKALTGTTTFEFYNRDKGTNYAQARYLCYYLQEKGLLRKYYRAFVANQKDDPTGYATLKEILDEKEMDAFKKRWEKYILALTFP